MLPSGEYGALSYDGVKPYHDFSYPTTTLLQLKKARAETGMLGFYKKNRKRTKDSDIGVKCTTVIRGHMLGIDFGFPYKFYVAEQNLQTTASAPRLLCAARERR